MLRLIREQEPGKARQPLGRAEHPSEDLLERFMRGELPTAEAARVIRHLLKRCSECLKVTHRLWYHGEGVDKFGGGGLMDGGDLALAEAREQVSRTIGQLETIHWQLVGVARSLPESAKGKDPEAEASAELRKVIECVLADRIRFALGDLRSVLPRTEGEDQDQ